MKKNEVWLYLLLGPSWLCALFISNIFYLSHLSLSLHKDRVGKTTLIFVLILGVNKVKIKVALPTFHKEGFSNLEISEIEINTESYQLIELA
jgi:hypothetical protein